jgi:hypothetical protein
MNLDLRFKESEEYKTLYNFVKSENPGMSDYIVDIAIMYHKANPQAYKQLMKDEKKKKLDDSTKKEPEPVYEYIGVSIEDPPPSEQRSPTPIPEVIVEDLST